MPQQQASFSDDHIPFFRFGTQGRAWVWWLVSAWLMVGGAGVSADTPLSDQGVLALNPPIWTLALPARPCQEESSSNCHVSAPVLVNVDGDSRSEIVLATNNGHVLLVDNTGAVLWNTDIAPAFGMAPDTQQISSSPAVADIDGDGYIEIVVGAGTIFQNVCTQGGVIALSHLGQVEPGWPRLADDWETPPAGCRDTIFATPALGDLDLDGRLEIVAGGFDKRIYAWRYNGVLLPNFPVNSVLLDRLGWPVLDGRLGDTIWGSPALADMDGDGYLDIIISTDEGNLDSDLYGGGEIYGEWSCPYALPPGWIPGYCGGSVYGLNRFGQRLPGFPRFVHEAIQSAPAVQDLNGDGRPEIIVGTGTFYYHASPDHPTDEFRVYVWDDTGEDFPGWAGGKPTQKAVSSAPAVGDITGDGQPEIVAGDMDGRLYAWQWNGQVVPGFPMLPLDLFGNPGGGFDVGVGPILADYDGDGAMEIVFTKAWVVNIVDGNGHQLTSTYYPGNTLPIFYAEGSLRNSPAVGDIDGDGKLELVAFNSRLYVWDWPQAGTTADWPVYRGDAARTAGEPIVPHIDLGVDHLSLFQPSDETGNVLANLSLFVPGTSSFTWETTPPQRVTVTPATGSQSGNRTPLTLIVHTQGLGEGTFPLGTLRITVTIPPLGEYATTFSADLPITLRRGVLHQAFLPITRAAR